MFTISYFDYMYTYIGINLYVTEEQYDEYEKEIRTIFETYHQLTTSYDPLPETSPFLNNIYSINENKYQRLEINEALYDVLVLAKEFQTLTDDYFNIMLGTPVKIWKSLISNTPEDIAVADNIYIHQYAEEPVNQSGVVVELDNESLTVSLNNNEITYELSELVYELEVSDEQFQNTQRQIEALTKEEPSMLLESENGQYFITFEAEDQTIDLGAFSKGYAVNLVKNYLVDKGVEYFSINAGSSSISVGKNYNRPDQDEIFIVSLTDPRYSQGIFSKYYGVIHLKDTSIATSGNFEQYTLYEGVRYHHIISPQDYYPVNEYYALTIVGGDAGLLDALSTALFVMDIDSLEKFMNQYQESLGIQVVAYLQDGSIRKFTNDLYFEDKIS